MYNSETGTPGPVPCPALASSEVAHLREAGPVETEVLAGCREPAVLGNHGDSPGPRTRPAPPGSPSQKLPGPRNSELMEPFTPALLLSLCGTWTGRRGDTRTGTTSTSVNIQAPESI